MACITNKIPVISRTDNYARILTDMLNKDINKKRKFNANAIKNRINEAAKKRQELEAESKMISDAIKKSEAAKAYHGIN